MSKLIVSFTSYPERIGSVKFVLDSLYAQSLQADEIILWLAEDQFPKREADLPLTMQEDLAERKFTVRWCENLGSHKKYFYVMQEYPEDIIVTVDDDTFYHKDTLKSLMDTHARFPRSVAARTVSLVRFDSDLNPLPISDWLFDFQSLTEPSMLLMAIGVGGVLYPPHSVGDKIFDKDFILENCTVKGRTSGDDLLLKTGEILNHTAVVAVKSEPYIRLPKTQETALAKLMPNENHKNLFIQKYKERFQEFLDIDSTDRLKRALSDFEEMDNKLGLNKAYWFSRPSRDLERQIGYLSLPDGPSEPDESDYKGIKNVSRIAARVFTAHSSGDSDKEAAKAISDFKQKLMEVPGIEDLAETDVVIRGFIDYDVPLNTDCHIIYHDIPMYMRSLKNWQTFMAGHRDCDSIYHEGYQTFLKNTEAAMGKAEGVLSKAEIDEWKLAYDVAVNGKSINSIVSDDVSPLRRLARKVLPKSVRRAIRDIIK